MPNRYTDDQVASNMRAPDSALPKTKSKSSKKGKGDKKKDQNAAKEVADSELNQPSSPKRQMSSIKEDGPETPSKIMQRIMNDDQNFEDDVFSTQSEKNLIAELKDRAQEENQMAFLTTTMQQKVANKHQFNSKIEDPVFKDKLK